MAARRRRSRNSYLENLGGLPRSTMLTFGLALLLLVASVGIVGTTLVRRGSAEQASVEPTPEATPFVAIVETPPPPPETPTGTTPTVRTTATSRPSPTTAARRTPTAASAGPLGSGPGQAARGIGGSMATALGGTLPPAQSASAPVPTATRATSGGVVNPTAPPPLATPTPRPPVYSPPPASNPAPGGGGNPGGGGGNPPAAATSTPTPRPPTPTTAPPTPTTAPPTATPTPTQPALPAAVLPVPGARPYSYDLTFTQGANLAVPASNFAYIVTWRTYTIEDATALKSALGLTGQVERTGDGYKVVGPGTLLINNTAGTISYTAASGASESTVRGLVLPTVTILTPVAPPPSSAPSTAPSPSPNSTAVRPSPTPARTLTDEAAVAAAKDWLTKANVLPANADGGRVTRPTPEQVVVTFHPQVPGALIAGDPMIKVTVGVDGTVREVYHRWPTNANPRSAALRNVNTAWAEVADGGGYLEVDQTVPTTIPNGTVFRGAANVTSVSIGWSTAQVGADGSHYLVPVYVFQGTVTLSNPPAGQPNAVPFRVYVPAVATP